MQALKVDAYSLFDLYCDVLHPSIWKNQSEFVVASAYSFFVKPRSPKGFKHPTKKLDKLAALEEFFYSNIDAIEDWRNDEIDEIDPDDIPMGENVLVDSEEGRA